MKYLECTVTFKYPANPAYYGTSNPEEMAAFDTETFKDDFGVMMDVASGVECEISVKPVDND
jgi:hypothetical protein